MTMLYDQDQDVSNVIEFIHRDDSPAVCAEIEYHNADGERVHSDLCPPEHSITKGDSVEYRALLHSCLDEWLERSGGTGMFWIGEAGFKEGYV